MKLADFLAQYSTPTTQMPRVAVRRQGSALRALELFSGAGLATEGLLAAGIDMVRCIEWNRDADATARGMGHPSVLGDVRNPKLTEGIEDIDLVWASPPCQAWSMAGKRLGVEDPRNGFPWTMEVIDRLTPRWVLIENVPGLTFHRSGCPRDGRNIACAGCYWQTVVDEVKDRYAYANWKILNAADYGAPQLRERVYLVAGPKPIAWPEPTHHDPKAGKRPRWRTIRDVTDVPGLDGWCSETNRSAADYRQVKSIDRPISTIAAGSPDSHTGSGLAFSFGYAVGSTIPVGAPRLTEASLDAQGYPRHHGLRRPSVDETGLLMGMPSGVAWCGNVTAQRQQIGNGCCPQPVTALAQAVVAADRRAATPTARRTEAYVQGSRFLAAPRTLRADAFLHDTHPTVQLWSVVLPVGERTSSQRAIEKIGGHHLDWFPWEEDVPPLAPISTAEKGSWLFLVSRDRIEKLREGGWISHWEGTLPKPR